MIDETLFEAEEKMEKAVHVARDELGSLRTGRASPNASPGSSSTTTARRPRFRSWPP